MAATTERHTNPGRFISPVTEPWLRVTRDCGKLGRAASACQCCCTPLFLPGGFELICLVYSYASRVLCIATVGRGGCSVETDCWKDFNNTAIGGGIVRLKHIAERTSIQRWIGELFGWNALLKGLQYSDRWGDCSVETDCWKDFNTAMGGGIVRLKHRWNRVTRWVHLPYM
jgi:hypothetical protein